MFLWFANHKLSQYVILDEKLKIHVQRASIAEIGNASVIEIHEVKLLGITIDRKLKFKNNMQSIYSKSRKKLNAVARL